MPEADRSSTPKGLVLGWRVSPWLDPEYWLKGGVKAGAQTSGDLVTVPASAIATHTAIIAQSGSGKSTFLGRLVEEIMLKTKARCLVVDPNSDFRRVSEVESEALWKDAKYDLEKRRGRLPHETTRQAFAVRWDLIKKRILTGPQSAPPPGSEEVKVLWTNVDSDFLAAGVEAFFGVGVYHCHEFVKAIDILLYYTGEKLNAVDEAREIWKNHRVNSGIEFRAFLETEFSHKSYLAQKAQIDARSQLVGEEAADPASDMRSRRIRIPEAATAEDLMVRARNRCAASMLYMNEEVANYYFGVAERYRRTGVVDMESRDWFSSPTQSTSARLNVLDIPTLDPSARSLAVDSLLAAEWRRAQLLWERAMKGPPENDRRVPTFIVVDEAHNFIPSEPRGEDYKILRERFLRIAAEGRKYGLFLILVSQRPDKLDPRVLSECENRAVMKLGSQSVLNVTKQMLGLEDLPAKTLGRILEFELGRVLIAGAWSGGEPQFLYAASRRTVEGGRGLTATNWAVESEELSSLSSAAP